MSGPATKSDCEPSFLIREFSPGDATSVLRILNQSPEASQWSLESVLKSTSSGIAWTAEASGEVAGFLVGRSILDEFEILNLAVSPPHRRKGIAGQLIQEALSHSRTANVTQVYLEVRASNVPAIALYSRAGFIVRGRRPQYYQCPVEDAILLSCNLHKMQ